jgi:hypothetical protein
MIAAAEMDVCGKFDSHLSRLTRTRISHHAVMESGTSTAIESLGLVTIQYKNN